MQPHDIDLSEETENLSPLSLMKGGPQNWYNTIKYKYYGHESFYNLYALLTAKLIKHPLPLEMGID